MSFDEQRIEFENQLQQVYERFSEPVDVRRTALRTLMARANASGAIASVGFIGSFVTRGSSESGINIELQWLFWAMLIFISGLIARICAEFLDIVKHAERRKKSLDAWIHDEPKVPVFSTWPNTGLNISDIISGACLIFGGVFGLFVLWCVTS